MTFWTAAHGLWFLFLASWTIAMLWTAKATSRGDRGARIAYFLGFAVGFTLLFAAFNLRLQSDWFGALAVRPVAAGPVLWRDPPVVGWMLVAAEATAFLFAWWARLHLGALWSGMMTLREGHRVVDSGPYRLVRHPIYTGLIGGAWALALIVATPAALAGAAILTGVMTRKAKDEERLLRRELGPAAYDAYAARTPMIVPFVRAAGLKASTRRGRNRSRR